MKMKVEYGISFSVTRCICSKSGLMSHEFFHPGVYYYSDQGYSEAAPYMGTIIVKPKVVEQFIEVTKDGFSSGKNNLITSSLCGMGVTFVHTTALNE